MNSPIDWWSREQKMSPATKTQLAGAFRLGFRSTHWVEHEAVDSLAGGEHHHGGATVEGVACRHEVPAGLQGVLLRGFIICGLREAEHSLFISVPSSCQNREMQSVSYM